jgi:hypothetical protein
MIELLETRIAPAGLVNVAFRNGDLFLTGDAGDHTFTVSGTTGGGVIVTPADGLLLKLGTAAPTADAVTIEGMVRDLTVNLRNGDDKVTFSDLHTVRNVSVSLGSSGSNALTIQNSDFLGSVKVAGAGIENSFAMTDAVGPMFIGGNLSVNFAKGFNSQQFNGVGLQIGGNFSYRGSLDQDDVTFNISNLRMLGNVDVRTGLGYANVEFNTDEGVIFGSTTIVVSGQTNDGSSIQFTNAVSSEFGKAVRIIGSSGEENVGFNGEAFHFSAGFAALLGSGSNALDFNADRATFAGSLAFSSVGALSATLYFQTSFSIGGDFVGLGGSGDQAITLQGMGVVHGKTMFSLGGGVNEVYLLGSSALGDLVLSRGVSWSGNLPTAQNFFEAYDTTFLGSSSIVTGPGFDAVAFHGVSIQGPFSIKTGGAQDFVVFNDYSGKRTVINAPVSVDLGAGDDIASLGFEAVGIVANARLTLLGGSGQDSLEYLTHGNTFNVPPVFTGFETIT